jgi:hypothetical protein
MRHKVLSAGQLIASTTSTSLFRKVPQTSQFHRNHLDAEITVQTRSFGLAGDTIALTTECASN